MKLNLISGIILIFLLHNIKGEENKFFIIPIKCWDEFLDGNVSLSCISTIAVKVLSLGNISVAFVHRIPHISLLLKNKSTIGLSGNSMILETISLLCVAGYYFTFRYSLWNYIELYIVLFQQLILFSLVYKYDGISCSKFTTAISWYAIFMFITFNRLIPFAIVELFLAFSTIMYIGAKLNSSYTLFKTKYSGNLSIFTLAVSPLGILSRLITNILGVKDLYLIVNL